MNKKIKNEIAQQYLASSTNYVICVDVTKVGRYGEVFLAIDLASRCIVGHCYSLENITTLMVCETIATFMQQRQFLPKVQFIHSDKGSIFTNKQYIDFVQNYGIIISQAYSKANQNQVIERLNRSFKDILREKITPNWKKDNKKDPLSFKSLAYEQFAELVHQSIEFYNNRPHTSLQGLTPNEMEEALFKKHSNQHPNTKDVALITTNDKSLEAAAVNAYKQMVIEQYQGDWASFFVEWRFKQEEQFKKQEEQHKEVIAEIRESKKKLKEKLEKDAESARREYQTLYEEHLETRQKMSALYKEMQFQQQMREEKLQKKLKKQKAKKLPLRDTINPVEFDQILTLVKGKPFTKGRRKLALTLLFLTGLRVSNLLLFQVRNIKELLENGQTVIPLIKGGEKRHRLTLSTQGKKVLLNVGEECFILTQNKSEDQPLFTSSTEKDKPLRREFFDLELNNVLKKASNMLEKNIRTHSFRATLITELLQSTPIDQVKDLIGHRSIASTLEYKRSTLTNKQAIKILNQRDLSQLTVKRKRGRPKKGT